MTNPPPTLRLCYTPVLDADNDAFARDFDPASFDQWIDRLADRGYGGMLLSLVLKLERLGQAPLSPLRRLTVLHRLLPAVHDLSQELPKLRGVAPGNPVTPQSVEQRLWCLAFSNLMRLLLTLDAVQGSEIRDRAQARLWVVESMFACLARQAQLSALWDWPLVPGTWQEGHDLYAYYVGRLRPANGGLPDDYDPEVHYKRLLLTGLIAAHGALDLLAPAGIHTLENWARQSELHAADTRFGVMGALVVESSRDAPPHRVPGALNTLTGAWVLEVPAEFLAALDADRARKAVFSGQ